MTMAGAQPTSPLTTKVFARRRVIVADRRLAAATAWPTRRLFSSGRCSSILPARSG
jgi:hypothetical protein